MHDSAFLELSVVIAIAAGVSLLMRALRQPLILAYIVSGIIVGPAVFNLLSSNEAFTTFSSIGVALLLFIIGLGLNIAVISKLGKAVFVAAGAELVLMGGIGALVIKLFGFGIMEALIIGLSLFFSSTIIIVKVLSDKKEQNRLHGQIAVGVILLDDIVATLALLLVAAGKGGDFGLASVGQLMINGALLGGLLIIASAYVLPKLARATANSQEMLFLFAIAWGFGVASLFELCGFSIEIGALFAGVSLASLPYSQEIESRLKPLRDFFVVLFFIVLGSSLQFDNLSGVIVPALCLSLLVLILKPLGIIGALGLMGFSKRVSFMTGIHLSQVSEFSIILVVLATANGIVSPSAGAMITIIAIVTIAVSTYLTKYDSQLFERFDKLRLKLFERADSHKEETPTVKYPVILFGYHRGGHEFVKAFKKMKHPFVVVDYDPHVIEQLQHEHIPSQYGDATDLELLEEVGAKTAKLVVSTIADFETNQQLIRHLNLENPEVLIVCNANSYDEALQLYELGSSYVMIPHYAGSESLGKFIMDNGIEKRHFDRHRAKHLSHLEANHPVDLAEDSL
jgi:Kef-type K+ transport system membrane component KefB